MKPSGRFEFFVRHGGLAVAEFSFKEFESLPHGFGRFVPGCSAHNFREGFTRRTLCLLQDFICVLRKRNGLKAHTQSGTQIADQIKLEDLV
jgi:hypothetical protein